MILADRDKVEMEEEIKAKVPDLRGTRVVCRSGSPIDLDDLALSSHPTARSVILLAPDSEDPDSEVIKTLLALTHGGADGPTIVAEIRNPTNLEAARLVGAERTVLLDIRETVAKLVVQTSRQSGAAAVYTELFDYDGDEIYFLEQHELGALTYGEAQLVHEKASVIGIVDAGVPILNPPPDTHVGNRTLIVVAEDDAGLGREARSIGRPRPHRPGHRGAGRGASDPRPGHRLERACADRAPRARQLRAGGVHPDGADARSVTRSSPRCATSTSRSSRPPRPTGPRSSSHVVRGLDQVIVLCYSEHLDVQAADARTLVTLLHVRDILGRLEEATPVVSEMLDDRNRVLAQVAHVDDVVVSGEIVSLLVTQLSEDQRLERVFAQLLGDDGQRDLPAPGRVVRPARPRGHLRHDRGRRDPTGGDRARLQVRRPRR